MAKKVLIVDDSALMRKQLKEIIGTLGFEIDTAKNGKEAVEKAIHTQYNVITMDVNMPVMSGIEALKQIMQEKPTPILMVSSFTTKDAMTIMNALDFGATDYIVKPGTMNFTKHENHEEVLHKVKSLSQIPIKRLQRKALRAPLSERKTENESVDHMSSLDISKVVLVGSSTGGPSLIEQICASIPIGYKYPICIVQHMPEEFTKAFTQRLNRVSCVDVYESSQNMELKPGSIYIARGGIHMTFKREVSGKIIIHEDKEKSDNHFQPSINKMMYSAINIFGGENIVGVILTGIGDDGADAMVKIKESGGYTLGESEKSATVYGMPKEAYERGGVVEQLDFIQILKKIVTLK